MNVNDEYRWLIYNKLVSLNTYQFDELMNNKKRKIYRSFADVVKKGKK